MSDFQILMAIMILMVSIICIIYFVRHDEIEKRRDNFDNSYRGGFYRWSNRQDLGDISNADRVMIQKNMSREQVSKFWRK